MLTLSASAWRQLPCKHHPRCRHAPAPPLRASFHPQEHEATPSEQGAPKEAASVTPGQPQGLRIGRLPLGDPTPAGPLPPLEQCQHFVNLTNGIEAIPTLQALNLQHSYVRLESTACEQGHLEALLLGLDANLLMSVALGHCCLVWDLGSRNKTFAVPRALWYGLEFVRYVLYRKWLGRSPRVHLRGRVVSGEFESRMQAMRRSTFTRLSYYKRWLQVEDLRLHGVYRATGNELVPGYYQGILDAAGVRAGGRSTVALERVCVSGSSSVEQDGQRLEESSARIAGTRQLVLPARPGVGQVSFGAGGSAQALGQQAWLLDHGCGSDDQRTMLDSEQRLMAVGYQVHYRGLSPQEWQLLTAQMAADKAAGELHE